MTGNVREYAWDESALQQAAPEGLDIREYLRVAFKHKWGIISVALLGGLIGLYSAYKAIPIYSSKATLQVERESRPQMGSPYYSDTFQ